jgi:hypothetical protein
MDDFESRLRAFRPRRPASIPDERLQFLRGPMWLATAALIAAAMFIASWLARPRPQPVPDPTLGALTTLAVESPDQLDGALTRMSRSLLPDVRDALSGAAKESQ